MNKMTGLRRELMDSGASVAEARELAQLAGRLHQLRAEPTATRSKPLWLRLAPASAAAVVALVAGMSLTAFAQSSLPGSWLYPVKRISENTAVAVHPQYRATLMMRRADEVRQLVAKGSSGGRVEATLADYQQVAKAYKGTNYPAFEYCKTNLQQAEQGATAAEKQAIAGVLKTLGDIN